MRYSIETFYRDDNEYLKILIPSKDFKQFVIDKLSFYPIYLASAEERKWMKKLRYPVLLVEEVAGSQRVHIEKPIFLNTHTVTNSRERYQYREKTLAIVKEYMEESLQDFKALWNTSTYIKGKQTVDMF